MTSVDNRATSEIPVRRFSWLKMLLIVSLALNLLFIGGAVARWITHGPPERFTGLSQMQLIPRKFFGELGNERRRELLLVFRGFGKDFRDGRKATRDQAINLAAALETEPYDPDKVKAAVDTFTARSSTLVTTGGAAALSVIGKLSPEERKLLAKHIRLRDDGGKRKDQKPGDGG